MLTRFILCASALATSALCYACSEANDGAGERAQVTTSHDTSNTDPTPDSPTKNVVISDGGSDAARVVLNELSPGDEWVELANVGDVAVDVSGWVLADHDKTANAPKLDEAATMPEGTLVPAGGYLMVRGGGLDAGACPGPATPCVHAAFGISNKTGETLYWMTPEGAVAEKLVYPPAGAAKGTSWGRVPNGDARGEFAQLSPTPGAANTSE